MRTEIIPEKIFYSHSEVLNYHTNLKQRFISIFRDKPLDETFAEIICVLSKTPVFHDCYLRDGRIVINLYYDVEFAPDIPGYSYTKNIILSEKNLKKSEYVYSPKDGF